LIKCKISQFLNIWNAWFFSREMAKNALPRGFSLPQIFFANTLLFPSFHFDLVFWWDFVFPVSSPGIGSIFPISANIFTTFCKDLLSINDENAKKKISFEFDAIWTTRFFYEVTRCVFRHFFFSILNYYCEKTNDVCLRPVFNIRDGIKIDAKYVAGVLHSTIPRKIHSKINLKY